MFPRGSSPILTPLHSPFTCAGDVGAGKEKELVHLMLPLLLPLPLSRLNPAPTAIVCGWEAAKELQGPDQIQAQEGG